MIDAHEGVTEQDTKVAGLAHEAGKACIIVVNKWDLVEKDDKTMDRMRQDIRRDLSYMTYAPILFISALTGQRVARLFELINYVNDQAPCASPPACSTTSWPTPPPASSPPRTRAPPEDLLYDAGGRQAPLTSSCFCNDGSSSTSPTSAIWKTRSAACSAWRARPSADHPAEGRQGGTQGMYLLVTGHFAAAGLFLRLFQRLGDGQPLHSPGRCAQHGSGNAGLTNFYRT